MTPEGSAAVPELVQKKVARNESLSKEKAEALAAAKKSRQARRHGLKMNAMKFEKEYRLAERHLVNMRREAKAAGKFFVEPEAKLSSACALLVSTSCRRSRAKSCSFCAIDSSTTAVPQGEQADHQHVEVHR